MQQENLIFLIGSPRSGSTLTTRMIASHSQITAPPEPHLVTPLAHLGYYENVDKAPYDWINSGISQREYVATLPGGESDYLDACRAYLDVLYGRRLEADGKSYLLEKTPAYALVVEFLVKVYPKAKYVVLTRHPMAVWSSFANSFFEGDYEAAHRHNRLIERYVPKIAWMLREAPVPLVHVRYEDLVKSPEEHLRRICEHVGIEYEDGMVEYGKHEHDTRGRGDPINVGKETRPTTKSVKKWAAEMAADPAKLAFAQKIVASLDDDDVRLWGFERKTLLDPVAGAEGSTFAKPPRSRYRMQRRLVTSLRNRVRRGGLLRRLFEKLRFISDVLLRE